ncbi:MAG: aminotransferase class I/II-fold pyridoxal phosphate-dependent enzyme [bacterium]|nr:aminotransferase class I/II-fold pyridoxal phosphate-dependent enzyme [bacterium]
MNATGDELFPFTQLVKGLSATVPFVGPDALERRRGEAFRVRLGANESAFGISPKAREAMREAVDRISWYNDPENYDLREALAAFHNVAAARIGIGSGIDDLLGLVARIFMAPGDVAVASQGSYPTFHFHVSGFGGRSHTVPYRGDCNDLNALARAAQETGARLVYLANPDNPAGTWCTAAEVVGLVDQLPVGCLLILDEAYIEFAPEEVAPPMVWADPRVIRMRTFSKAHGMAGARVGYAIAAAEIVEAFEKVRHHFGVNRIAQIGALASLNDPAFVFSVVASVAEGRQEYEQLGEELGMPTLPSATNFVSFDAGHVDRAMTILNRLQDRGVFVRKPGAPPLDRCFRVTVGKAPERQLFAEVLRDVIRTI